MRDKKQKKIEKCQKKIEKFTKKLQKYRDMLTELTTDEAADVTAEKTAAPAPEPAQTEAVRPAGRRRTAVKKTETEAKKTVRTGRSTVKTGEKKETTEQEAAVEKIEAVQAADKEAAKKHAARARRPRGTSTEGKKPVSRRKDVAVFALYNCDEGKSQESMYNRNDETFRDTQLGRRGLWAKLKTEITEGRIELLDGYPIRNVRREIESGSPESVSAHLKYGLIEKIAK